MAALCATVEARVGRFGFNPTDQGFILGTSRRILDGQVPHADIVSARPLGSSILHVLDFALPGPLFLMSGTLAMLEIVLTTVALAALVTRRPVLTWGPLLTGLVAAASLVNLNLAPLMAWHTTDGIALTALGWWALDAGLRSGRAWPRRLGLFLLGFAALTKQSFAPAPVVGLAMLLWHPGAAVRPTWREWRRTAWDVVALVAAPVVYFGVVAAAGGLSDALGQLTGAAGAYDQRIVAFVGTASPASGGLHRDMVILFAAAGVLVVLRRSRRWLGAFGRALDAVVVLGALGLVGLVIARGGLGYAGDWGLALFWMAAAAVVVDGVTRRRVPWRGLLVLLLAAMSGLSWGVDSPTALGGTLALTVACLLVPGIGPLPWARSVRPVAPRVGAATVAAVLAVGAAGAFLVNRHDAGPYRDRPQAALTAHLGRVAPALDGLRSTPGTLTYLEQLRDCVAAHPAANVAVLPDNPFAYAAFGWHDPFPMDWPIPMELVHDAKARMLATVPVLNRRGDYLVLFQTIGTNVLAAGGPVPAHVSPDAPIAAASDLEPAIRAGLTGERIGCGSFVGVWSPAR